MVHHNIDPVFNKDSRILILGSFPSVKSREMGFFYGHPQNRFWKILSSIYNAIIDNDIDSKKAFLLLNNIALWDVIESCDIKNSSDSSIKNVKPNNIKCLLEKTKINKIYVNGKTALKYYKKYLENELKIKCIYLPSSSPLNASYSLDDLIKDWQDKLLK